MAKQIILGLVMPIIIGLVVAFVPNGVIWFLLAVGIAIVLFCAYSLAVRMSGKPSPIYRCTAPPWWFDAVFALVGGIIIISAAPGLFFGQPSWAIDHVYRAISLILGDAA